MRIAEDTFDKKTSHNEYFARTVREWKALQTESLVEYAPDGKLQTRFSYYIFQKKLEPWQSTVAVASIFLFIFYVAIPMGKIITDTLLSLSWFFNGPIFYILMLWCAAFLLNRFLISIRQPTHLGICSAGLRLHWQRLIGRPPSKLIPWENLTDIRLVQPTGTTLVEDQLLVFNAGERNISLALKGLVFEFEREKLYQAIEEWAPNVNRDFQLAGLLGKAEDNSYTELWLKALAAPPERERLVPSAPGMRLKNCTYEIESRIGMGGQGTAYKASILKSDKNHQGFKHVVLKEYVLPVQVTRSARTQGLERLQTEAKLLQKLNHDSVVKLLDFFVEDHRGYLVLELIDGCSLRAKVACAKVSGNDHPFSEAETISLALKMCETLTYLHNHEPPVVHRDFTPDNLLLTENGKLKLIDFNVAHQTAATTTATVVGKHAYLPPEQFRGKPSVQSDIYAFGCTLHYLLTGNDPQPLSVSHPIETRPDISPDLDELIAKCTALKCDDRFKNIAEVREALLRQTAPTRVAS